MGDRRASSSASWLSEGSQRGQGQCSAQSRVVTMHLIVQELLVFLVVPAAIEVPASVWGGSAQTQNLGLKPRTWVGPHVQIGRRTSLNC
jgi:hypothetical protein